MYFRVTCFNFFLLKVVVPHIGSATYKARTDMAVITAKNIIAGLEGSPMPAKLC